ncbi:tRNA 2-thiocytidine biosynthesis protein TtcA [Crassaminicella thermophila]|uniref:tRNA 2-thiocytidine biosynthesis protein TtcA n=1 Tax=Crassaminicella thermophila TaxID=2599308 RepID=A0A5C0SE59_CRATE|nr:tRNA 2-thiocytidine biosynthesis TtcA family protein [Crassaminicella thermophila]QEK11249.1 tRNA 2-thiocytidine biosynthesis protein TtcA [Crassaminicella thermophila]
MKKILGNLRKAVSEFNLINENDQIAVGLSGGKDSMTLLYALKLFQKFSPVKYHLEAVTISMGFENFNFTPLKDFCNKIKVPYTIENTHIGKIVFDLRKEKNPCSLCANMRRGALYNVMQNRGLNVLALGHNKEDTIETLFMNMLYNGRIKTFLPKTYLEDRNIKVIRPLVYVSEHQILAASKRHSIPIVKSPCPVDKQTAREDTKNLMLHIYKHAPKAKDRILTSIKNKDQFELWFDV